MIDVCKACGSDDIQAGYGMAYGGMGVYFYCANCDELQDKHQDPELAIDAPPIDGSTADCEKHGEYVAGKGCEKCIDEAIDAEQERLFPDETECLDCLDSPPSKYGRLCDTHYEERKSQLDDGGNT